MKEVRAYRGGKVIFASWNICRELGSVTVKSDGGREMYGSLSEIIVTPGQTVLRNDILGYMESEDYIHDER